MGPHFGFKNSLVTVIVEVDEARCHNHATAVDFLGGGGRFEAPDRHDAIAQNCHISRTSCGPRPIHEHATTKHNICIHSFGRLSLFCQKEAEQSARKNQASTRERAMHRIDRVGLAQCEQL